MGKEFGIFADDGMIEGGFYSQEKALEAIVSRCSPEDDLRVEEVCLECRGFGCDECDDEGIES